MKPGVFYGYMAPNQAGVTEKLDLNDRKILYELSRNGRLSTTAVAKAVRLSREVVDYRLKRLQEREILTGFTTLIDTKKLGQLKHIVYLRLHNFTKEREEAFANRFFKVPHIAWVASCGGGWDLGLLITSKTIQELSTTFDAIRTACGENLNEYMILSEVHEDFLGLGMLIEGFTPKAMPLDREGSSFQRAFNSQRKTDTLVELTTEEKQILQKLSENPRASILDIAKSASISAITAKKSVTKLIKEGVIFGVMPMISLGKLGYQWHPTFLRLNECRPEDERRLIEYLRTHPNVPWYIKTVGPWNMQLSVFARDAAHYREILNDLRKEFSPLIKDYSSILVFNQYKYFHEV